MPFEGQIHLDPGVAVQAATARAREVRCSCARSPFCRGQASVDWLTCSTSCRACRPDPWQPPAVSVPPAVDGTPEGANGG
jgi:hypothetical protein